MKKIADAKYKIPLETRQELIKNFYTLYDAQEAAGENLKDRPSERVIHMQIVAEYATLMEDGVTFDIEEVPLKVLNKKYVILNDSMSNKMFNFIYGNIDQFDFADIRKKIDESELTPRAIEEGLNKDILHEAADVLENFVKAYEDLINWVSLDRTHFNAIAYIGNYFMKIKNLFNDADS